MYPFYLYFTWIKSPSRPSSSIHHWVFFSFFPIISFPISCPGSLSLCRPLMLSLPWPRGSGGRMLSLQPCETSPPCLQSCGGKWHWTKECIIPVSDSILSARVNEREASFCPYAAAFSPATPERRGVFDACPALRPFFLSFWMRR